MKYRMKQSNILRTAVALLTVLALVAGGLSGGLLSSGRAVDLAQACSVTVSLGEAYADDLRAAELTVDLYQLAAAVERPGEDAYDFQLIAPYEDLSLERGETADDWQALAQAAMAIALAEGAPLVTGAPVEQPITETNGGNPLPAGLYLMLVRGKAPEAYVETAPEDPEKQVTVAYAGDYKYVFAPELLSLPTRAESGPSNTADDAPWIYDLTLNLKAEQAARYGEIQITKTLLSCAAGNPGLFIFLIEAELDGVIVYSDVVSLDFYAAGTQVITVDRIPVGATVTVREIYSGVGYTLVSGGTQTLVIDAETPAQAAFVNDYTGSPREGGGVTNTFTYDEDEGWSCDQRFLPDD